MKNLLFVFTVAVLAFSCNKDGNYPEKDRSRFNDVNVYNYSFKGVIKDTTNGNSLIGYKLYHNFGLERNYKVFGTIIDSSYFISVSDYFVTDTSIKYNNKIQIRNSSNVIIDSFAIPFSIWVEDGIATYNYNF